RPPEAAVRPLLHQEPLDRARPVHHPRDHQDGGPSPRRLTVSTLPAAGARIVNAMTVDVEDYFHVSVFEKTVDRSRWDTLETRVRRNTDRLLDLFDEHDVRGTFFVL